MAASVVARLVFWLTTHRVWEDALITLAPVRNAFTGIGLTHHAGEGRVYSFTSALSVLIPLAGELVHRGSGLLTLRLASLVTAPVAVLFTALICRRLGIGKWPAILAMTYVALDHEEIFFGMAGMETQVATAILLASVYFVMAEDDAWTGITFGLALLARPDFVLWVFAAAGYILWTRGVRRVGRTALLALALYGPWLLFTQVYYGSVIPQTIQAKAIVFSPVRLILGAGGLGPLDWIGNAIHLYAADVVMFAPFYESGAITSAPVPLVIGLVLSLGVMVLAVQGAWRTRHVPGWMPAIVYLLLFLLYRVLFLGVARFGWYLPPFRALVVICAAAGLVRLGLVFPHASPALSGLLAALFALASVMQFPLDHRVQQIEDSVRIQVGIYLGRYAGSQQGVVSESSGYVGYYSHSQLHDYPGLTSRISYQTLAQAPPQDRSLLYLVYKLRPDWVVLRPAEKDALAQHYPDTYSRYAVDHVFQSDIQLFNWGIREDTIDSKFYLLKRQ